MSRTEYQVYEVTIYSQQELDEIPQFKLRYTSAEVRSKFVIEETLGFYPLYYTVTVVNNSPLKTVFLMLFPRARLRTIFNCATVALG